MNKINLVGIGPGNIKYISELAKNTIKNSDIIIGSKRQVEDIQKILTKNQEIYFLTKLDLMLDFIKNNLDKNICLLVSGDTGFYSIIPYMKKNFNKNDLNIIPAISSFQYLFSKIGENWQNFLVASVHGRNYDYITNLKNENIDGIVLLTDDKNNPYIIAKNLFNNQFKNIQIIVGENLSYENEKITFVDLENYEELNRTFDINVCIIKKG